MIFSRLRQSLSRYLKGTHRVGGQLKFFERRPLNPTCVFKTREKEEKKNGTVSFLIRQSIHARINSIGHLTKREEHSRFVKKNNSITKSARRDHQVEFEEEELLVSFYACIYRLHLSLKNVIRRRREQRRRSDDD